MLRPPADWCLAATICIVEILATKSAVRPGVRRERATDLLLLYLGMDVYRVLVLDFGWMHEHWIAWTLVTPREQVFTP